MLGPGLRCGVVCKSNCISSSEEVLSVYVNNLVSVVKHTLSYQLGPTYTFKVFKQFFLRMMGFYGSFGLKGDINYKSERSGTSLFLGCLEQAQSTAGEMLMWGNYFSFLCSFCLDGRAPWMRGLTSPDLHTGTNPDHEQD